MIINDVRVSSRTLITLVPEYWKYILVGGNLDAVSLQVHPVRRLHSSPF